MAAQVIDRDRLGVLTKIGQGGQGTVYQAPNVRTQFAESMVYKEYKTTSGAATVDYAALAAMPALVEESLTVAQAKRLIALAAWPCALVQHGATPTGFVMPAIPAVFFTALNTAKGTSSAAAEIQHLLNHPSVLTARGIGIDDAQRYQLLRETATALTFLHQHGVVVGDISPKNLLYALGPRPVVYFIDCDAMRVGGMSALPQLETPGWQVPAGEELATVASDTYKLGLLALRLLVGDQHTTNPQQLPATTPTMVRQLITDTLTNPPQRRPLPQAWSTLLAGAVESAQHQQKMMGPALVGAAPAAPAVPVVRSRPPASPPTPPSNPPAHAPAPAAEPSPRPDEGPPPQVSVPPRRPWWRRKPIMIPAALLTVVVIAVGCVIIVFNSSPWVRLPFKGIGRTPDVAVDEAGNVYVADRDNYRVVELAAGSNTPTVLLNGVRAENVAVDTAGNVYITDEDNHRVLKLAAGSNTPTELPFNGVRGDALAVDIAGNVYIANDDGHGVLKLAAGSNTPTELPFTGLLLPQSLAVDLGGDVFVTDRGGKYRVLKLAAGSNIQTELPLNGRPSGTAVDSSGNLYVGDMDAPQVLKLAAGSWLQAALPNAMVLNWHSIHSAIPNGVAVDPAGNVYITDVDGGVLKLAAGSS
jgi:eukaryotic-like serine/threonine-protein kinase